MRAHRYLSTLLQVTACQVLLTAHVLRVAFRQSCRLRGETAGIYPFYSKLTFSDYNLHLCYFGSLSSPPSFSQVYAIANERGSVGGESRDNVDRINNGMGNNALSGIGD